MKNHNIKFLNYFSFIIKVLFFFLATLPLKADENNIGTVSEVNGVVIAINDELEERDLSVFDPIFSNEEIFTTENSSTTLQFNDDTSIIMKELTSLVVSDFENSKLDPEFKAKVSKGEIIIETGSIAKNKTGEMEVTVKTSSLGLRGTRISAALDSSGKLDISLGKDNFGNVGLIELVSNNQRQSIFSTDQVIEISDGQITGREKSTEELNDEKLSNETFVKNSKINEEEVEIQLISKLTIGKINDVNNDGKVDTDDVEVLKKQILNQKQQKIEFIIDNSKKENTEFLSNVINNSDEKNTGEALEKIINTKDDLIEDVTEDLSDRNNEFLITSKIESAVQIKEKIFETIVLKETDKSAEILSKVMSKSDEATISSVINNITEKNKNEQSKLSLKVMSDFSEKNPEKLIALAKKNKDEIQKLTVSAVEKAISTKEDADLIANIVINAGKDIANNIVNEVNKNSNEEKESLSAKVINSIIDADSEKFEILNEDNKKTIINKTIEVAKKQVENNFDDDVDLTSIVGNIIVNTETDTSLDIIENLNEQSKESESDLSLKVLTNISKDDDFEDKFKEISDKSDVADQIVEELIEKAIDDIKSDKDIETVVEIIDKGGDFLTKKIIEIEKKTKDKKKSKINKIINKIIKEDPIKAKKIIEKEKEKEIIKEISKPKKIEEIKDVITEKISPN
tara:strand:- start:412 stop:2466 length:2055 start_codon:yes stop_codon:yes gene_type:complete